MNKETMQAEIEALVTRLNRAPSVTPFVQLIKIGQRIAQRHVSGQTGEAMDRDAQRYLDLMGDLPDELRGML